MPSHKPKRKDAVQTRTALLAAAAEIFAQRGFKDGKVRLICDHAGVNLGAVSHYFGSKEALYKEVLILAHKELLDHEPIPVLSPGQDPRVALKSWTIYALRLLLLRRASHPYAGRLIAWEIREPTAALDTLVAKVMSPVRQSLEHVIAALLAKADEPKLRGQCANFVMGLCVFHEQGHEVLRRFGYPVPRTEADVITLAELLTDYALGGIKQIGKHHQPPASR